MPAITVSSEIDKPIDKWSSRDFVIYFFNRLSESTGSRLKIEGPAWGGFSSRIKGFRTKLVIPNKKYKDFIDTIFSELSCDKFVPVFGAIVSERVYFVIQKLNSSFASVDNSGFKELRNQLYSNNTLFKKLQ
jgi:hypothetical protein